MGQITLSFWLIFGILSRSSHTCRHVFLWLGRPCHPLNGLFFIILIPHPATNRPQIAGFIALSMDGADYRDLGLVAEVVYLE